MKTMLEKLNTLTNNEVILREFVGIGKSRRSIDNKGILFSDGSYFNCLCVNSKSMVPPNIYFESNDVKTISESPTRIMIVLDR